MKSHLAVLIPMLIASVAYADLIADYKLDFAKKGPAEAAQIMDSIEPPSDAVKKINYPIWTTSTNTGAPVPGDGIAIGMTQSNGHEFGLGTKGILRLEKGGFSIFARLFSQPQGEFRIERKGVFVFRLYTDRSKQNTRLVIGAVNGGEGRAASAVIADPGTLEQWHDYVFNFKPSSSLELYVDGRLVISAPTNITNLAIKDTPFRYENYLGTPQFLESLKVYNAALSPEEILRLSK
ncbi:MAG: LamG-like jellyroll fold domain-containing protein [Chthoniobacteraceae bacterium]